MTATTIGEMPLFDAHARLREWTLDHPLRLPMRIQFRVAALSCQAQLQQAADGEIHLHLSACLGHLPFSGENGQARQRVIDWLKSHGRYKPGRLYVDRRGRLWFDQPTILPAAPNALEFLAILSQLLFILMPDVGDALEHLIPHHDEADGQPPAARSA